MKFNLLFTILVFSINGVLGQKSISEFKKGEMAMITRGSHDSWLIMNDSNEVAFLSPHSGTINLYSIDLDDFSFIETNKKGLLMAEYIASESYLKKYTPITNFSVGAMDSPDYSPNGALIAFRTYVKDTANSKGKKSWELPWNFSLMIVDTETKALDTLLSEEVNAITFLSDSTILFQQVTKDLNWLQVINIHTKVVTNLIPITSKVNGITSDNDYILVHENLKASLYNKKTLILLDTFSIPEAMQRITYMEDYLILTPRGSASSFMKVSNGKTKPIVGTYDYEPSVSRNKKYVIVVSENLGGGIIYKLK